MDIMRYVRSRSAGLMAIVILSGFISCVNEQETSDNSATDYELSVAFLSRNTLSNVFINGTDVSSDPLITSMHTSETTATVEFEIKVCDYYTCYVNLRKCTVPLDSLAFDSYVIQIYYHGDSCDLRNLNDESGTYEVVGIIENTNQDYTIQTIDPLPIYLNNMSINGYTDTIGDEEGLHTLDTNIEAHYSVSRCIVFGCYTDKVRCNVSIDSLPYGNYFLQIVEQGKGCKISPLTQGDHPDDVAGVVTNLNTAYTVEVYNSSIWTFHNLRINGHNVGQLLSPFGIYSHDPVPISGSSANLFWQHKICYMGYCVSYDNSCSVSLAGKPFATYIIHVIDEGKICMIK